MLSVTRFPSKNENNQQRLYESLWCLGVTPAHRMEIMVLDDLSLPHSPAEVQILKECTPISPCSGSLPWLPRQTQTLSASSEFWVVAEANQLTPSTLSFDLRNRTLTFVWAKT